MGRVYAVVSAKGGVGKTTTAANLAAALAAAGSRVAVVDGDLGMANLASALGVEVGEVTLHDVLASDSEAPGGSGDTIDVAAAIHEGPHGLSVVPGSPAIDAFSRADPERLEGVLADLAADHDYVILDTGAGLSNDTVVPLTYVDEILLVSTPTRDALGDTDKTRQVAERLGATVAGAALLRADPAAAESDVVVETLDAGILGTVPDAEEIQRAADAGEPLTTFAPESPAAAAFASLAAALTGEHVAIPAADPDTADETDATPDPSAAPVDEEGSDDREPAAPVDEEESGDQEPAAPVDATSTVDTASPAESSDETESAVDAAPAGDTEPDADAAPDDATADTGSTAETDEASVADATEDTEASEPDSAVDAAEPTAEAVDDSESPVTPADPDAIAADDDDGVYTTPLEEVPIEEAEPEPEAVDGPNDAGPDADDAAPTSDTGEAADSGDSDEASEADSDDSDEDDSGGGGFFSRFFG